MKNKKSTHLLNKPYALPILTATLIIAALLTTTITLTRNSPLLCSSINSNSPPSEETNYDHETMKSQMQAIVHYATSEIVPQQSLKEITISLNVLQSLYPCNFLVYGLGYDSIMWSSLNPKGTTLFLEEDPIWVQTVLKDSPNLHVHTVHYPTRLSEADQLLSIYKTIPSCLPLNLNLKGRDPKDQSPCPLLLTSLPEEVYEREWDLIMIDAPRGYFSEAPGRMGAIFTAAAMARARTRPGKTHVFVHDVNRRVEKMFALEFLCRKYLVEAVGRLWHFEIPPAPANLSQGGTGATFC
ncbi:Polysaccharide biosynthesis domain [Dillenia turbinata]|uniref:Polysaccharide biosynthesis domain n=1 Tax=Dillenia turbinata TaxID=194707 RepID=A0AAN8Z874_9MAGN